MPGILLGAENIAMNKTGKNFCLQRAYISRGGQINNKIYKENAQYVRWL